MDIIYSMPPIIDKKSQILILGTMPGNDSLKAKQYYSNRNNLFWDIMFRICDKDWPMIKDAASISNYDVKKQLLLDNKIALWDILKSCRREGNSDNKIKDEELNDLKSFLIKYPNIKKICLNGEKAYSYFKHIEKELPSNIKSKKIYSTSSSSYVNSFCILKEWYENLVEME